MGSLFLFTTFQKFSQKKTQCCYGVFRGYVSSLRPFSWPERLPDTFADDSVGFCIFVMVHRGYIYREGERERTCMGSQLGLPNRQRMLMIGSI